MQPEARDLREYLTEAGKCPFEEWLDSLRDPTTRARIRVRLNRLRLGLFGDCKHVGDGVHELRMDFGPGYRAYFGQDGTVLVILLLGGDKRSQKRDIVKAKEYWDSYKRRTHHA
jgi:putative addiction module killer protein